MLRRLILLVLVLVVPRDCGRRWATFSGRTASRRKAPTIPIIANVARDTGVDPFLIRALIWRESRFNPLTHGLADEHGLMQVTPDVGQMWAKANKVDDFKDDDLYDPETNIRVGTWYLDRALKRWSQTDDPVTFALAEYNAGRKQRAEVGRPARADQITPPFSTASPSPARANTSK